MVDDLDIPRRAERFWHNESESWYSIGFKFGIGFGLAGMIFGTIGAIAAYMYTNYEFRLATTELHRAIGTFTPPPIGTSVSPAQALQNLNNTAVQAIQNLNKSPTHPAPSATALAPEDNKKCLEQTHGNYNEEYLSCMNRPK